MQIVKTVILAVASAVLIAFTVTAFAHDGMGWGGGWGHHGQGWHHRGEYRPGYDQRMNPEQYRQFEAKRDAFFRETRDLRAGLDKKERELQNELAKAQPDAAKASGLQKEISELRARLDQKRIDHLVEMRKLAPDAGHGFMGGGPGMGRGYRGGGYCWR